MYVYIWYGLYIYVSHIIGFCCMSINLSRPKRSKNESLIHVQWIAGSGACAVAQWRYIRENLIGDGIQNINECAAPRSFCAARAHEFWWPKIEMPIIICMQLNHEYTNSLWMFCGLELSLKKWKIYQCTPALRRKTL